MINFWQNTIGLTGGRLYEPEHGPGSVGYRWTSHPDARRLEDNTKNGQTVEIGPSENAVYLFVYACVFVRVCLCVCISVCLSV